MSKTKILAALAILAAGAVAMFSNSKRSLADTPSTQPSTRPDTPAVLNFTMKSLAGNDVDLGQYKGKVLLIVNTASKCGNTPQYAPLEKLNEKYADKGLSLMGFPSNDFGQQEPGTDEEISTFCTAKYGVKFDMFSKVDVLKKMPAQTSLYKVLTTTAPGTRWWFNPSKTLVHASSETEAKQKGSSMTGEITWNFEKFLIGRDGTIVARFAPTIQPDSPEVVSAIEAELAK